MATGSKNPFSTSGCIATALVVLAALAVVVLSVCTVKVNANSVGVRTLLTSTGVEEKDYGPGYVLCIPGFHVVRMWDPTWTDAYQTIEVRGSDQYTTTVDVSVVFRIAEGQCHVVAKNFSDYNHIKELVRTTLGKASSEILAQMKTEDFYNSEVRIKRSNEAHEAMDKQLRKFGIEVAHVLLRKIVYDPKFEAQLLNKQLASQRKSLEIAKGQMATAQTQAELIQKNAEADVKQIDEGKRQDMENMSADTDRKIAQILQDAKQEAAKLVNKAESERRQKLAEADFLKASAEATGTGLMSKAYAHPGAHYYFARKAIEGLKLGDVEVNSTSFNPLDSERLLKALGLDMRAAPANAPLPAKNQP